MGRQTHCADHDHGHGHGWVGRALLWVALVYLLYGSIEVFAGWALGAALLSADGTHNLADGVSYLVFYVIDRLVQGRKRVKSWSHLLLGVAGPVSYAAGFFLPGMHDHSHHGAATAQSTSAMVVLGALSYQLAKRCHGHSHGQNAGLTAHLAGDMAGAAGVVVAALVLPFVPQAERLIAGLTFSVMAYVAIVELKPVLRTLRQQSDDHKGHHNHAASRFRLRPVPVAMMVVVAVCFALLSGGEKPHAPSAHHAPVPVSPALPPVSQPVVPEPTIAEAKPITLIVVVGELYVRPLPQVDGTPLKSFRRGARY